MRLIGLAVVLAPGLFAAVPVAEAQPRGRSAGSGTRRRRFERSGTPVGRPRDADGV